MNQEFLFVLKIALSFITFKKQAAPLSQEVIIAIL